MTDTNSQGRRPTQQPVRAPHTEAPWVCQKQSEAEPWSAEIATVCWVGDWQVGVPTPGYPGGNYRDTDYGSDEADARLIAAAPELYEALKRCLPLIVGEVPAIAIDALAKAGGKDG
jgi:hypothetical protein